jgi:hypothetical protein
MFRAISAGYTLASVMFVGDLKQACWPTSKHYIGVGLARTVCQKDGLPAFVFFPALLLLML